MALQGNHVILSVPFEDEMVFLECTNQQHPFNYLGSFTDDRKVLMVTPEGGVMIKTHTYDSEENLTTTNATAIFDSELRLSGVMNESSSGISYSRKYFLETEKPTNVFLESSYRFAVLNENNSTEFSIKGGAAIFLNSSVAFEIALEYLNSNANNTFVGENTLLLGFGVQIHLERR